MAHFLTKDSFATIILRSRLILCCSVLLATGMPRTTDAFVLGELQHLNKPGQPFQAIAPITLDPGEEIVTVEMGEAPDYLLLNLARKEVVNHITVQLKKEEERLLVAVQSSAPIQEKDFHILLRVSSNQHTYFPFFHIAPTAQGNQNRASQAGPTEPNTTQTSQETPRHGDKERKTYGPVRSKDGLGGIARRFQKGSDASISQVAVAIWHLNPDHFIRNNMNGLKTGGTLIIPAPAEMTILDKQQASALLDTHAVDWKKPSKQRLAVMPSLPRTDTVAAPAAPEKAVQTVESTPPSAKEPTKKIAPTESPKQADKPASTEPDKATTATVSTEPDKATPATVSAEPAKATPATVSAEPAKETTATVGTEPDPKKADPASKEQVKVESGALKAILVQLQVITRVLENHHDRQEQLEKRVASLEKNQEQRDQLEKRVSTLERAMQEWNFLTKGRSADTANDKK